MKDTLIKAVNNAKRIVVFSGAGMSTASGIPDFRSANGLYKNVYRSEQMLSHSFFMAMPEDFYTFYKDKMIYESARPNFAHEYFARLQHKKHICVITQNIDGLHQMAGQNNVLELHGSIHRNYCMKCGKFHDLKKITESKGLPRCECGGMIKPDVVLYEEGLDEDTINKSIREILEADLMIILGTSLNVYPAAGFVRYFKGEDLAIINLDKTDYDDNCDIVIHDDIVKVFKEIEKDTL